MEQNEINEENVLNELLMQSGLIIPYNKSFTLVMEERCRNFIDEK